MRHVVLASAFLFAVACGPDPNARLPASLTAIQSGGDSSATTTPQASGGAGAGGVGSGGTVHSGGGTGGTTVASHGGAGGSLPPTNGGTTVIPPARGGAAGSNPFDTGGTTVIPPSSGGAAGTIPVGSGGATGTTIPVGSGGTRTGGVASTGGKVGMGGGVGAGGVVNTGGAMDIDGGGGTEPCTPAATVIGTGSGNSGNFGTTGEYCFRTPDNIAGWNCSNFTGRTLKVNGVAVTCGGTTPGTMPLPAKVNGYYYFDASAGGVDYASIYWF